MAFFNISLILAFIAAGVMLLIAYSGGTGNYEYYGRRESVDMSWSLPVKRQHRFWGDFISGFAPLAVVYWVSALLGLLIMKIGFPEQIITQVPQLFPLVLSGMFMGFILLSSVFIIAVFCAALCGRAFEAGIYPAVVCGLIPALIALFGWMVFSGVWQINVYAHLIDALRCSSPFGFFIGGMDEIATFVNWFDGEILLKDYLIFRELNIVIPFVLIHGGFLTAAYYLAKKRKAENTGKAFAFKYANEIIASLVMFAITAAFCYIIAENPAAGSGFIFGLVTCTAIAYLVIDVTAKRGFRKMGSAGIKYVCMVTGSVLISLVLLNTNGFGIGEYVPPLDEVESVHLNINNFDEENSHGFFLARRATNRPQTTEFKDSDVVKALRDLHVASNKGEYEYDDNRFNNWGWWGDPLSYTLKSGGEVTRNIRYSDKKKWDVIEPLIAHPEHKESNIDAIDAALADGWKVTAVHTGDLMGMTGNATYSGNLRAIYDAYKADYLAETPEQKFQSTGKNLGILTIDFTKEIRDGINTYTNNWQFVRDVVIRAHYTNLIAELNRQGISLDFDTDDAFIDYQLMRIYKYSFIHSNHRSGAFTIGDEDGYRNNRIISPESYDIMRTEENAELVDKIFDVMQPWYPVKGEGYVIGSTHGSYYYVVPPQYKHIAEELFELAKRDREAGINHWDEWHKREYEYLSFSSFMPA
jgi:hypothetical protein